MVLFWSSVTCFRCLTLSSRSRLQWIWVFLTFDFGVISLLALLDSRHLLILCLLNYPFVCLIQLHVCPFTLLKHGLIWSNLLLLPNISFIILIRYPHDLDLQRLLLQFELLHARLHLRSGPRIFELFLHKLFFDDSQLVLCLHSLGGFIFQFFGEVKSTVFNSLSLGVELIV